VGLGHLLTRSGLTLYDDDDDDKEDNNNNNQYKIMWYLNARYRVMHKTGPLLRRCMDRESKGWEFTVTCRV
jgi:hypothetical protein